MESSETMKGKSTLDTSNGSEIKSKEVEASRTPEKGRHSIEDTKSRDPVNEKGSKEGNPEHNLVVTETQPPKLEKKVATEMKSAARTNTVEECNTLLESLDWISKFSTQKAKEGKNQVHKAKSESTQDLTHVQQSLISSLKALQLHIQEKIDGHAGLVAPKTLAFNGLQGGLVQRGMAPNLSRAKTLKPSLSIQNIGLGIPLGSDGLVKKIATGSFPALLGSNVAGISIRGQTGQHGEQPQGEGGRQHGQIEGKRTGRAQDAEQITEEEQQISTIGQPTTNETEKSTRLVDELDEYSCENLFKTSSMTTDEEDDALNNERTVTTPRTARVCGLEEVEKLTKNVLLRLKAWPRHAKLGAKDDLDLTLFEQQLKDSLLKTDILREELSRVVSGEVASIVDAVHTKHVLHEASGFGQGLFQKSKSEAMSTKDLAVRKAQTDGVKTPISGCMGKSFTRSKTENFDSTFDHAMHGIADRRKTAKILLQMATSVGTACNLTQKELLIALKEANDSFNDEGQTEGMDARNRKNSRDGNSQGTAATLELHDNQYFEQLGERVKKIKRQLRVCFNIRKEEGDEEADMPLDDIPTIGLLASKAENKLAAEEERELERVEKEKADKEKLLKQHNPSCSWTRTLSHVFSAGKSLDISSNIEILNSIGNRGIFKSTNLSRCNSARYSSEFQQGHFQGLSHAKSGEVSANQCLGDGMSLSTGLSFGGMISRGSFHQGISPGCVSGTVSVGFPFSISNLGIDDTLMRSIPSLDEGAHVQTRAEILSRRAEIKRRQDEKKKELQKESARADKELLKIRDTKRKEIARSPRNLSLTAKSNSPEARSTSPRSTVSPRRVDFSTRDQDNPHSNDSDNPGSYPNEHEHSVPSLLHGPCALGQRHVAMATEVVTRMDAPLLTFRPPGLQPFTLGDVPNLRSDSSALRSARSGNLSSRNNNSARSGMSPHPSLKSLSIKDMINSGMRNASAEIAMNAEISMTMSARNATQYEQSKPDEPTFKNHIAAYREALKQQENGETGNGKPSRKADSSHHSGVVKQNQSKFENYENADPPMAADAVAVVSTQPAKPSAAASPQKEEGNKGKTETSPIRPAMKGKTSKGTGKKSNPIAKKVPKLELKGTR